MLDAIGSSKDLLKKGFHIHFKELKNLELSLQYTEENQLGKIVLGFIKGEASSVPEAIKIFNEAMANTKFVKNLIVRLKAAQETLTSAATVLRNADEVRMATERAEEIGKIIKILEK